MNQSIDTTSKSLYNVLKKRKWKDIKFNGSKIDIKLILKSFISNIVSPFFYFLSKKSIESTKENNNKKFFAFYFFERRTSMINKQNQLYELLNEKNSLNEIQSYIREIITIRGFSEQRVQSQLRLPVW